MLAADADLQLGVGAAAALQRDLDQLAHALLVDGGEGVGGEDALGEVRRQEARLGVVAGEAEGGLGEVVAADAEESGESRGGEGGRGEGGAGELLCFFFGGGRGGGLGRGGGDACEWKWLESFFFSFC